MNKITKRKLTILLALLAVFIWAYLRFASGWKESESLYKSHPVVYLERAAELLNEGDMEQAVFWYYVGQMRYRLHLMANPDLEPTGDPMVFSAMKYLVGEPVNQYAGDDPDNWIRLVRKAMKWDKTRPNLYTSKEQYAREYEEIHAQMDKLINYVDSHREEIRQQKAFNGLDNQ